MPSHRRRVGGARLAVVGGHVRTNHAHAVVTAQPDPRRVMSDMKARASRELTLADFGTAGRHRWTRHGSTLHLFRQEEVEAKIRYTLDGQGPRMAWYAREERHRLDPRHKNPPPAE